MRGYAKAYGNAWFRTMFKTGQFRGERYGPPFAHVPVVHQHSPCPRKYEDSYVHKCLWLTQSTGWFGGTSTVYPGGPRVRQQATARHMKKVATTTAITGPLSDGQAGSAWARRSVSREWRGTRPLGWFPIPGRLPMRAASGRASACSIRASIALS